MKTWLAAGLVTALTVGSAQLAMAGSGGSGSFSSGTYNTNGGAPMRGQPYGQAGCGLGSLIFGPEPGLLQAFAATTNTLSATQTFGITSGTMNCDSTSVAVVAAHHFIETNREAFAKDVSRGSGETIDTIASISGCADHKAVAATLQRNFTTIFPSARTGNTQVSAAAISSLKADKRLACSRLI